MDDTFDVDVCIVGSGPAGALIASELAPTGKRIAIVEAGTRLDTAEQQRALDAGTDAFLIGNNDPRLHLPIRFLSKTNWRYYQVRKVGGNSLMWGGMCPRGLPSQFTPHSTYGVSEDWPVTYDELEPYYSRAEQELGVAGDPEEVPAVPRSQAFPLPPIVRDFSSEQFARACAELGYSCQTAAVARANEPYRGRAKCHYCTVNVCACCPTSARYKSVIHIDAALRYPNTTLLTDTVAARLVFGENGRPRELACFRPDRTRRTIRAGVFVVACNSIGSARLLLASFHHARIPSSKALGRYYMGHPVFEHHAEMPIDVLGARSVFTTLSRHFEEGPHIANGAGFRMFFHSSDQSATMHGLRLLDEGLYGTRFKEELRRRATRGVRASFVTDCLPRRDNGLDLDLENLDYFGVPGITFRYEYSEYEERGRRLGAEAITRILDVLGAKKTDETGYDFAHQLGTTRMGNDRETSVVDPDLRVHGIDNLYVSGGSVFPTALGPTNPTLTIAALSLRLARHLRGSA